MLINILYNKNTNELNILKDGNNYEPYQKLNDDEKIFIEISLIDDEINEKNDINIEE